MNLFIKIVIAALFLGSVAAIIGANLQRDKNSFSFKWSVAKEVPIEVKLEKTERGTIQHRIEAPGEVEADVEVKVSSQVMGRIVKLPVAEGQLIKKGEVVAQIDAVEFEAQVRSGEATIKRLRSSIEAAQADVEKSTRDLEQNKKLLARNAVGATNVMDFETLFLKDKARLEMAKAELLDAEAILARSKKNLLDTTIRTPLDGIVSQLNAKEGEVVVLGTMNNPGTQIMSISDPSSLVVRAKVDESDVPLVKAGQKAFIHFQHRKEFTVEGRVLRITPKGFKGTGKASAAAAAVQNSNDVASFETLITFDKLSSAIRMGMSVNVEIEVNRKDEVLTVPTQSVLHRRPTELPPRFAEVLAKEADRSGNGVKEAAKRYMQVVFVEKDGKTECRLVTTGITDGSKVEILSGLKEKETIVTGPYRVFDKLREGTAVKEVPKEEAVAGVAAKK